MNPLILEIVLFAAVAAFLLFRLRSVLGTRTGNEDPPEALRHGDFGRAKTGKSADIVVSFRSAPENEEVPVRGESEEEDQILRALPAGDDRRAATARIREIEPWFRLDEFLDKARAAYEWIYLAFEQGAKERLRPLLDDVVYEDFERIIDKRVEEGLVVDARLVGVLDASVEKIELDPDEKKAEVDVRFTVEVVRAVRNSDGEVVDGDPKAVTRRVDNWAFARALGSEDPNWILIEA